MPSGGARARSGPAPDPNALRRDRATDSEWTTLPAAREGDTPEWPLSRPTKRELALWAAMWERPQAVMWERNQQEFEVGLYVRRLVEAEQRNAPVSVGTLVRQMQDSLGLSIPGLRSHRWRIDGGDEARAVHPPTAPSGRPAARQRFQVVTDVSGA